MVISTFAVLCRKRRRTVARAMFPPGQAALRRSGKTSDYANRNRLIRARRLLLRTDEKSLHENRCCVRATDVVQSGDDLAKIGNPGVAGQQVEDLSEDRPGVG